MSAGKLAEIKVAPPSEIRIAHVHLTMRTNQVTEVYNISETYVTPTSFQAQFDFNKHDMHVISMHVEEWNVGGAHVGGSGEYPTFFALDIQCPGAVINHHTNVINHDERYLMLCPPQSSSFHVYYETPRLLWKNDRPRHLPSFKFHFFSPEHCSWERANVRLAIKYIEVNPNAHSIALVKNNPRAAVESITIV